MKVEVDMTMEIIDPNYPCLKESELEDLFRSDSKSSYHQILRSRLELHIVKTHCNKCRSHAINLIDMLFPEKIKQQSNSGLFKFLLRLLGCIS